MAWNAIQSYPSVGNGIVYNGHGMMWAEVPWSGHYYVNSPIFVSAHYTQATAPGWEFLPVGSGSGMLPGGGSYVSLVSPDSCNTKNGSQTVELTLVVQTMSYDLSKCFKDLHPPFTVVPQIATFKIATDLVARLRTQAGTQTPSLFVRRSTLFRNNTDNPYWEVSRRTNRYFEAQDSIFLNSSGEFHVSLGVDEIVTLSTLTMSRGDDSPGNNGLPTPPNATQWPPHVCSNLTGHAVDAPLVSAVAAVDQQGVWEAAVSRDPAMAGETTMQQVVPAEPDEWHAGRNLGWPQSFVGPAANLSVPATLTCSVLPPAFESGWAGIGIGKQTHKCEAPGCTEPRPDNATLTVWANGSWCCLGSCGVVSGTEPDSWFELSVTVKLDAAGQPRMSATVNGQFVASGVTTGANQAYANPFLAAAYSTAGGNSGTEMPLPHVTAQSNAEFKDLCLHMSAQLPKRPPSRHPPPQPPPPRPPPSPSPPPSPQGGKGLGLTKCDQTPPRPSSLWTFAGEDKGEAGTLRPSSNVSACLDVSVKQLSPIRLLQCVPGSLSQKWRYDSSTGQFSSVQLLKPTHGPVRTNDSRCLDSPFHNQLGLVGLFDCKAGDTNQQWIYDPHAGASLIRSKKQSGMCLINHG
jgi:hypothetical protein